MKHLLFIVGMLSLLGCNLSSEEQITRAADYNKFLESEQPLACSKYFELWNSKIKADSMQLGSFGIVAAEYNRYFKSTGEVQYLKKAERALKRAVGIAAVGRADYRRALARNYIAQHRFKEALELAREARKIGSGKLDSQYLLFDIHMELGHFDTAEKYLDSVKNMSAFGYLIRVAKWNDHKGDLATTLHFMERASKKATAAKNAYLQQWAYTNLADYYGHAGRISDSYKNYLKALNIDPNNAYALKGIAWIVFSFERNPEEALRILEKVTRYYKAPDYLLLKAQIVEYIRDEDSRLNNLNRYYQAAKDPLYGTMYNISNAKLYLKNRKDIKKGLQLAKEEVDNRATPETYGLLAYAYLKDGQLQKALMLVEAHILGKTNEPEVLLYMAQIYKASGNNKKVDQLRVQLSDAIYELGPLAELKIEEL